MSSNNRNAPAKLPEFSEETFTKLLEQQARETEVRKLEVDLRLQELKHNSAHAEKILGAQERDRNSERDHERSRERSKLIFAAFCAALVIALLVFGIYMGKDALVNDLVKILGGMIAGALGGYGYSKAHSPRTKDEG